MTAAIHTAEAITAELEPVPAASARTARLLWLYDNLSFYAHSNTTLFEINTPGAAEALRIWAGSLGLAVTERLIDIDNVPPCTCLGVTTTNYAHISVHVPVRGESK